MAGQAGGARLIVALLVLAALAGLVYYSLPGQEEPSWLYAGKKFSQDSAQAIQSALAAEDIEVFTDRDGRIGVRPSSWSKALAALRKKKVEPPSLEEIEKDYQTPNLWESREQREQRFQWGQERKLEVMIERLEDIIAADVTIHREQIRGGLRPETKVSAFVYIDAGKTRELSPRSIRTIQNLLVTNCAGLKPEAVSITDRSGKFYLVAGDPSGGMHSRTMARAEELRDQIAERLTYINGVDVLVQMEEPETEPPAAANPAPIETKATVPLKPAAVTVVNQPTELEPEATPVAESAVSHSPQRPSRAVQPPLARAKVWVQVPRTYYLNALAENAPGKHPSVEDLAPYINRTEGLIRNAISVIVPSQELGSVKIDVIPDAPIQTRAVPLPGPPSATWWHGYPAWLPGAAIGAGIGLLVVMIAGFGMMASRRPKLPARTTLRRSTLTVDPPEADVARPTERVRELIRANPEAAAGVLHRWINQDRGELRG
jgi:type III secretory pathway lipoprotein EscJ